MDNQQTRARTLSCPGNALGRAPSPTSTYRRASYCETPSLADRRRSNILNGELPWHTLEVDKYGGLAKLKRDIQRLHQGTDIPRFSPEIFDCQRGTMHRGKCTDRPCVVSGVNLAESLQSQSMSEDTERQTPREGMLAGDKVALREHIRTLLRTASDLVDSARTLAILLGEPLDQINTSKDSAFQKQSAPSSGSANARSISSNATSSTASPHPQPGPPASSRPGSSRCQGSMIVTTKDAISPATIICADAPPNLSRSSSRAGRPIIPRYASSSSLPTSRHANVRPQQRRYHSNGDRRAQTFDLTSIDSGGSEELSNYEPSSPTLAMSGRPGGQGE